MRTLACTLILALTLTLGHRGRSAVRRPPPIDQAGAASEWLVTMFVRATPGSPPRRATCKRFLRETLCANPSADALDSARAAFRNA